MNTQKILPVSEAELFVYVHTENLLPASTVVHIAYSPETHVFRVRFAEMAEGRNSIPGWDGIITISHIKR